MASRISELVLECRDPELLARTDLDVLAVPVQLHEVEHLAPEPREGFGGARPTLVLSKQKRPQPDRTRLHIDVNATDRDQDAELERLLALGARPADVGQTGEEPWHVLADPEGNVFCLLRRRLDPL